MIEILKEQLKDYLLELKKVNDEVKALFVRQEFKPEELKELLEKGAGLKLMVEACMKEIKLLK